MGKLAPRRVRRFARDRRGATVAEYTIILVALAVVAALAFRMLGGGLKGGMSKTGAHFERSGDTPAQGGGGGAGGGGAAGEGSARGPGAGSARGDNDFGGARSATLAHEEPSYAKFILIALGLVGGAGAVIAMMRAKKSA
jgi:Flp pilus assembly pilin Flp